MKKIGIILAVIGISCIIISIVLLPLDNKKKNISKTPENTVEDAIAYIKKNVSITTEDFKFVEVNKKGEYVFDYLKEPTGKIQLIVDLKKEQVSWTSNLGGID